MKKFTMFLILIISVRLVAAQPIIGIGHSKYFISTHMQSSNDWKLIGKHNPRLVYSDGVISFTYEFKKDTPGIGYTCTRCIADFKDLNACVAYIDKQVSGWKLRPNPDTLNLILMTDLFNDTIKAVVVGKRIIFSY